MIVDDFNDQNRDYFGFEWLDDQSPISGQSRRPLSLPVSVEAFPPAGAEKQVVHGDRAHELRDAELQFLGRWCAELLLHVARFSADSLDLPRRVANLHVDHVTKMVTCKQGDDDTRTWSPDVKGRASQVSPREMAAVAAIVGYEL